MPSSAIMLLNIADYLNLVVASLILATFRSDYDSEIECEYDFQISKQLCSEVLLLSVVKQNRMRL